MTSCVLACAVLTPAFHSARALPGPIPGTAMSGSSSCRTPAAAACARFASSVASGHHPAVSHSSAAMAIVLAASDCRRCICPRVTSAAPGVGGGQA
jgi:hypothetical protein